MLLSGFLAGVAGEDFSSRLDRGVGIVDRHGDLAVANDDLVERVEFLL